MKENQKSLAIALSVTLIIFFVELLGGFISNSLALISDAGHMLTDTFTMILALMATIFALQPATKEKTYGFYRLEILSALFNGSLLIMIAFYIFYQAYLRFLSPSDVQSTIMLAVATIGLLANMFSAFILKGHSETDLNVRGAFLHALSDLGSSLGVIVGGVIMRLTNWYFIDPVLGIVIAILILRGALNLVFDSVNILLEAAPKEAKIDKVASTIKSIKGVKDLHDLHVWTITSGINAVSGHVIIEDDKAIKAADILKEIKEELKKKYSIFHSTFQTECESCPEGMICKIEPSHEHK